MPKLSWKPAALLAPVPAVLVSCGTMEKPNIITIAWTGILNSKPPMTYVSIRPERHSYGIIKESGEFVINLSTERLVRATDWCGVVSGAKHDKFREMKLTPEQVGDAATPAIAESPLSLVCRVRDVTRLGSHDMFMAEIVSVHVDDAYIDKNGRLEMAKLGPVAYAHGEYFALGRRIGSFGYTVSKKAGKKRGGSANKNKLAKSCWK